MTEPSQPRALTYTEMMNGGRQQLEHEEHIREQELQQRLNELERDVDHLEQALAGQLAAKEEGRPSRWRDGLARSFMHCSRPNQ